MDYSIRIPATDDRTELLKKAASSDRELSKVKDILFKPLGEKLSGFNPNNVYVRLRIFEDDTQPATLIKVKTSKTDIGYTDEKEELGIGSEEELFKKAEELGYEKWGEILTHSGEFTLPDSKCLLQNITPVGAFIKIESPTQEGLKKTLETLNADTDEKIEKNAAVLLAEYLNLI
jgi:adenylate cyclase class IV